ncbi:hypothetical protein K470DRAFT_223631 [Piedraia hortae CBS 480.64]|uniref:DUF3752 domain-containing protein n=1 Tax=Piedraia hortae CBS 480.64 TaxID=1314780 RepID=A0A6A7BQY4_9PEZI|nr:hypothetical protein K470DRAFT_223631 [Piedraia hortae CBS 480.64]
MATIGPTLPPHLVAKRKRQQEAQEKAEKKQRIADSESDDDYGPALPSQEDTVKIQAHSEEKEYKELPKTLRDGWMTMPPDQDDLKARMDPSRRRARGFKMTTASDSGSTWNETPAEKRKRLHNEAMGITEDKAERIEKKSEGPRNVNRGPSLMEQHKTKAAEAEDDPSKRGFDREKDMKSGLGNAQRRDLVKRSSGFASKFSGGGFL